MVLKSHQQITLLLIMGIFFLVLLTDIEATELYDPNSWASMSIAFGASILTVVGIITSVVTSNVNDRRAEFIDLQNNILNIVEERERIIQDTELNKYYKNSKNKIIELIEERAPMKYSESYIGFASFFLFLSSVILAIYGVYYKFILGSFLLGIGLLSGYVSYCVIEFWKIDQYSFFPDKDGKLEILSVNVNGKDEKLLDNIGDKVRVLLLPENITIDVIEFKVKFRGKLRNGFLHSIVKYIDGSESHIPDRYTSLLAFGFIKNFLLTTINGIDTGMLHNDNPIELLLRIIIRSPKGGKDNKFLMRRSVPPYGEQDIYTFCSVPNDVKIDNINIRMYEDPLYRPKYKRRTVDLIRIKIERKISASKIQTPMPKRKEQEGFIDLFDYKNNLDFEKNWEVTTVNEGKIIVTNEIEGVTNTKCMKIYHPINSQAYVRRKFGESKIVNIEYYLRQETYVQDGYGSPFIIESPSKVKINGNEDDRPVYMDILNRRIRCGTPEKPEIICEIELHKWYQIILEINCINHTFKCRVNNNMIEGTFYNSYSVVSSIRTKYFGKNTEWTTYIDNVKVTKLK